MTPLPPAWRRRTFASLSVPAYRRYFWSFLLVMSGFWMRIAAVGWLVYELTGSTQSLGLVTAAALLPFVLFSPAGGALADRIDERKIITWLMLGVVAVNLTLAGLIFAGLVSYGLLLGYSFVAGCFRALEHPARNALVVRLVGREHLHNAIGLNAAGFHFTSTIGPVVSGVVYHVLGPGACFVFVGLAALPFAWVVPRLEARPREVAASGSRRRYLAGGFVYVWQHVATRALLLIAAAAILLVWSFRTLMPAISKDALGLGDIGYGALMSITGIGSFLGALWVAGGGTRRFANARALVPLVLMGSVGVAVLGVATVWWVAALGLIAAGFFHVAFMATANTQVQMMVPDALRARVMGIWALSFGAFWPLGGLWMGALAEHYDTHVAVLVSVGVAVVCILALRLVTGPPKFSSIAVENETGQLDQPLG